MTGFTRLAAEGRLLLGKPPYGYRIEYQSEMRGSREVRIPFRLIRGPEEEVRVVSLIFDCYARRDMSLADICCELARRGVLSPTGKPTWRPHQIYRMLKNRTYTGTYLFNRRHGGRFWRLAGQAVVKAPKKRKGVMLDNPPEDWVVIPNTHEALIDPDTFRLTQELLQANARRTTPRQQRGGFLLGDLLVCAKCGCRMGGWHVRGRTVYRCLTQANNPAAETACPNNYLPEPLVLDRILTALEEEFLNPGFLMRLRERALSLEEAAASDTHKATLTAERDTLTKDIDRAKRTLSRLDDDMVDEVAADIRRWSDRLREVEGELSQSGPGFVDEVEWAIKETESLLWALGDARLSAEPGKLRALLRRLVAWVEVEVETVTVGKRRRYQLTGGTVVLRPGKILGAGVVTSDSINLFRKLRRE